MNMIQVGLIGIFGVLLAVQLKQEKAEVAIYLCVAVSLIFFVGMTGYLEKLVKTLQEIAGFLPIDHSYIATLLKMLGITYLSEFASGICKDAGYQSIAMQIEMFGKLTILVLSLPILLALLRTIQEFFK